ncbi:MAG: hypothetical protein M3R06_00765 [Chloroflexota bacterium]|nr:hypothetical protein [Chloroflexota bacterium]
MITPYNSAGAVIGEANVMGGGNEPMAEVVTLNGGAVRSTNLFRRTVTPTDAPAYEEIELGVILRGSMANRQFLALLATPEIHVELSAGLIFRMTIVAKSSASSGSSEAAAYRHDLTLRETSESAARRAAATYTPTSEDEDDADHLEFEEAEDSNEPVDYSAVTIGGSATVWASAIRQIKTSGPSQTTEPPLQPVELAGIEAILVGLRLEALIDALDRAGTLRRSTIDDIFLALLDERFVIEATPVVGDVIAKRTVKSILGR